MNKGSLMEGVSEKMKDKFIVYRRRLHKREQLISFDKEKDAADYCFGAEIQQNDYAIKYEYFYRHDLK